MWKPVCPEPNQYETVVVSCPDGSTPVKGMCGNVKATATTTCAPLPPPDPTGFAAIPALIANVDHVKVASFADPVTECPARSIGCTPDTYANYGVIKAASTAPLKTVIYGDKRDIEPSEPSFPAEFFTANADCTVDGTSCRFIGADFSTNVMTEYDTSMPYIVDTSLSIPINTGVFVKQGTQNPPTFTAPPGYVQYEGGVLGSSPLGAVQTKATMIECAKACSDSGTSCTGFNFRQPTRECQLVTGNPFPSYTERNAVSFVKEVIPTVATYTAYPTGTNMTHEGTLCSNANICNADLTKLVGDGVVSSFSTADLESCSYCPVRSYDKAAGVVTNEVGTFEVTASTYQEHLLYKTDAGESSPELKDGFYSVKTWLSDVVPSGQTWGGQSVFGTQQILYSKNDVLNGLFAISGGKIYGTIQPQLPTTRGNLMDIDETVIYEISPVSYVDNGYVFRILTGGILAISCSQGEAFTYVTGGGVGYSCPSWKYFKKGSLCCTPGSSTDSRGTPGFNQGVFVFTSLRGSIAAFFSTVVGSKTYVSIDGKKWAVALGAPGLTTPIQTSVPVMIPGGGYGSSITTYGEFSLVVDSTDGIILRDVVRIDTVELASIDFTVSLVGATFLTLTFPTTGRNIAGVVIPAKAPVVRINVTNPPRGSFSTLASTSMMIPTTGAGSTVEYGKIQLNVSATTGLKNGDRVIIESDVTRNIHFEVSSVSGTMVSVKFNTTMNPNLGGLIIPQGTIINSSVFKKEFVNDMMFSWYQEVDGGAWTEIQFSNDTVKSAFLSYCLDDGTMKDPYDAYGLFRTLPLSPMPGAVYTMPNREMCDTGCSEYLLYNCYNGENQSCDTANGGALYPGTSVCAGTWKSCRPDNNTLLTTFSPKITNLTAISITRMDTPPRYSGLSLAPGTVSQYNKTDINSTKWSTIYVPETYNDPTGALKSKVIPKDDTTRSYFPSWTVERIVSESYLTITVSLAVSPTGCPGGYGVKRLNSTEFCEICPAGQWSSGGRTNGCTKCTLGNYCPQGSTNDTTKCAAGFYCDTPASQIACPLGFYCPVGSTRPISCDTEVLPDGTTQTTTITSGIAATTIQTSSVDFAVPAGFTFVKAAVVGLPGIVGPLKYAGGTTFTLVTPQFWTSAIPVGTTLTVQTKAHYCPLQSAAPQRCGQGLMCPTSSQQLFCPAGNYCNDGSNKGVFAGTQCPSGSYYAPPNVTNGNILAFGQSNTDGSNCYTCPAGTSGPTANQDGCICTDTTKTFSINTGTCIKICAAGSAPDPTDQTKCYSCPTGTYTNQAGMAACIKCADNFTSVGTANGADVTSGATGCRCTTARAGGGTLGNGTVAWDSTYNRCKVTCTGNYTPYWSDCVPNSVNATPIYLTTCPDDAVLYNGACYTCTGISQPTPDISINAGPPSTPVLDKTNVRCSYTYLKRVCRCRHGGPLANCPTDRTCQDETKTVTISPIPSCPAPCFTLSGTTCEFSGGTTAACYTCPATSALYPGTTYQIYASDSPQGKVGVGNQCPIKEPGVLNTNPPSPWGNDSLFDGNTSAGLSYLLTKLGTVSNFTARDGSVKCYPGKVCTNFTLTSGPSNGTAVTAGAACPEGYYCTSIDTTPIVCPLGSYCPAGAALPTACSTGSYCVEGSSSQTPCPAGYYCEKGNLKTPCLPGTYSASTGASSASTCLVCPAGSYCPSGSASATTCPVGNFCPMGSGALNQCSEGYYCPTTQAQIRCPGATTCPAGTSANYGIVCDRTTVPNGAYSGCSACPNPAAYYIWDPAYATSPTSIVLPPATTISGAYEPIRFRDVTVNNFNFIAGKSITAVSGGFKLTGTVLSSTASELVINVNGYSGTGTSSAAWTITPFGCDTVVKCQGHLKSSADFTKCEGCPLPAAGFIWAGSSGCETVQCTDGLIPSADLTTCMVRR